MSVKYLDYTYNSIIMINRDPKFESQFIYNKNTSLLLSKTINIGSY